MDDSNRLKSFSGELAKDTARYLAADEEEKQGIWNELISSYRFERNNANTYILKDGNAEMEISIEHERERLDLFGRASDYMKEDNFEEKMNLLISLKKDFSHEWDDRELKLHSPTTGERTRIAIPALEEFQAGLEDEEIDEEAREVYREIMDRNYHVTGTADKTFYTDGEKWLVDSDEIGDSGAHLVDEPGEKTSIDEMLGFYEAVRESSFEAAESFLDSLRNTFHTTEVDDYEVFIDSHNNRIGVYDRSNIETYVLGKEAVEDQFRDSVSDRIKMLFEFNS